jgi:hypothetical protein
MHFLQNFWTDHSDARSDCVLTPTCFDLTYFAKERAFVLLWRPGYFLFAWPKRKITKEKGHPAWRLPGFLPGKSVSRGRAFRTGILPVRKGVDILVDSRCAACRPRLTAAQGTPGRAAGHRGPHSAKGRRAIATAKHRPDVALLLIWLCSRFGSSEKCAPGARRSTRGPYGAAGGRRKARRVAGKDAGQFFGSTGCAVEKPVAHPRTRRAGCPQGAPSGWPLFWLLFSGHSEKSNSPSEGGRKLLL